MGGLAVTNSISKKRLQFSGFQFIFWACFAVGPYIVVFLREQGFQNGKIGLILSVNAVIGIVSQPIWGMISDWLKSYKRVFVLCMSVCSLTYASLFFLHDQTYIILLLCVDAFFRCAIVSITDAWMVSSLASNSGASISYGSIRLCGSIGFAPMVLLFGLIINGRAVGIIFLIYTLLVVITLIVALKIKDVHPTAHAGIYNIRPLKLLKNRHYLIFVIFIFFLSTPNNAAATFLPNLFEHTGGTMEQYGVMHSIKALIEVPFFLFGSYLLNRFGHLKLIIISAALYMSQMFLFAHAATPDQVMLTQFLQGPAYSLFLVGMLNYVFMLSPPELKATSLTVANAFGMGLSSIVGNYGGGLFIDHFGLKPMYIVGGISDVIIIALFVATLIYSGKRHTADISGAADSAD